MANPQKEDGYTPLSNEILDALGRTRVPGEAMQVLLIIIRQTYGFQKKEDPIALSQFVEKTGMRKPDVCRALAKLLTMHLIISEKANTKYGVTKYGLNKNHSEWKPLAKKLTTVSEKATKNSSEKANKVVAKKRHTKEIQKKKETITKESAEQSSAIGELIKSFEAINPACKKLYGVPPQREACINLIESYTFERVKSVIENTLPRTNSIPYFPTITTPQQLRDKWATLESAILKARSKSVEQKPAKTFLL